MAREILIALEIMAKGMGGIFAAILIIMLAVWIMGKLGERGGDSESGSEKQ